jgi:uncharacterized protein YjbI with pentapeptide repeats
MSQLLLNKDSPLRQSKKDDEVRTLARARTLTILSRLDGTRKGIVLRFLHEANLIHGDDALIRLSRADLKGVDLRGAYLNGVNLADAFLEGADLSEAYLGYANLRLTKL